ncbi:hypothetical protein VTN77DRAFT_5663 [Rasamsonia byssochlamydoides]|uniref:uncharacterized protein n=1 Tax=Rasamsonia byssochlamydoides TaxID=89139 RepID=UPI003741EA41
MSNFFQHVKRSKDAGNKREQGSGEDQDLTTLLDRTQRADLTVLVAQITESMRKAVLNNFDVPKSPGNQSSEKLGENISETAGSEADQKSHPQIGQHDVPTARIDLQAKAATLKYFDDWRDSVLLRIGEVVNRPDDDTEERQHRPQSQDMSTDSVSTRLREIYPPVETPLSQLPRSKKLLILHSLLLLLLSLKHYSAHSRVLLLHVASSLGLSLEDLNHDEAKVARGLLDAAVMMSADEETKKKSEQSRNARMWKVGIASVAGAALIGITGGLAAPLVAAGIGTVMGGLGLGATAAAGYLGALASSGVIVGGLFGAYGGRMTGRMMDKYAREVEDFAFIPTRGPRRDFKDEKDAAQQDRRLRVTIGITGWATEEDDMVVPWRVIGPDSEVFALRWELESLLNLGNAMRVLVTSAAWSVAGREILSRTIFAQIMSAVMLPVALLKVARVVDNPFSVAKARADKAGEVFADALINKAQGERPVTLIGYSLGSRVVFSCLQSLAKRRAFGLVETAILMGSPTPSNSHHWRMMRSVVSGRLVNVFSENDAVLALLYRASSAQLGVAGLQPIQDVPGVENMDASELVSGHLRYQYLIGKILTTIGFEEIDAVELRWEEAALQAQDRAVEQERAKNERRESTTITQSQGKDDSGQNFEGITMFDAEEEEERLQREVQQRTQEQMMRRKMIEGETREQQPPLPPRPAH